jgi:hypothetical protein
MRAEERSPPRYARYDSTGRLRPTHEKADSQLDELVNGGHFVGSATASSVITRI